MGKPVVTHVSGDREFYYPAAGDKAPPGGASVHILTKGRVCIEGHWSDDPARGFLGWAPLPMRNKDKEARVIEAWASRAPA